MAETKKGVFPCYKNQFQVGKNGEDEANMNIADCDEFGVSFDNGVEEWNPFESEGWKKRLMTSKALTISVKGKRNIGDEGNDEIASCTFANGREAERPFKWTFPDGATLFFANAVISVTSNSGGSSTSVGPLEFEVMSNGKPVYTPAA